MHVSLGHFDNVAKAPFDVTPLKALTDSNRHFVGQFSSKSFALCVKVVLWQLATVGS